MADPMTMSAEHIAELRALCEKATPGPWLLGTALRGHDVNPEGETTVEAVGVSITPGLSKIVCRKIPPHRSNDAAFIAAARTALPRALDEIERMTSAGEYWDAAARQHMRDANSRLEQERDTALDEIERLRSVLEAVVLEEECRDRGEALTATIARAALQG